MAQATLALTPIQVLTMGPCSALSLPAVTKLWALGDFMWSCEHTMLPSLGIFFSSLGFVMNSLISPNIILVDVSE